MNKALTEVITPEFLGIIWVTKDQINKKPNLFKDIDYLFDGLITRSIDQNPPEKKSLYMGKSYGHPFFLAHFEEDNPEFNKDIEKTLQMLSGPNTKPKNILVISDRKFNFKSFKNFHLKEY
jgi:hypothetical protein